jgi:catechol 2,3-dioxygenase-like lactoylglutathione lyase family enzyme
MSLEPIGDGLVVGVSHVAIGVSDMERSLEFYRDVLGLEVTVDRVEVNGGERPKNRRACYLRWTSGAGSSYVVLDQNLAQAPHGAPAQLFQLGIHHVSFLTTDIDAVIKRAVAADVDVWNGGTPGVRDGLANGEPDGDHVVKTIIMRDPDGSIVQLDQWIGEQHHDPS